MAAHQRVARADEHTDAENVRDGPAYERLAAEGYTFGSGAAYDFDGTSSSDSLVLGYSGAREKNIEIAVGRLHGLIADMRCER
ncbi:MAG TPA: hypothetical protein PK857_00990 [Hyphomicrobium sp.]|nr:hypothetical protein [Hyphomicrobium sp.]HRO50250.1 hypothetical protein [Hyphomicrobium sp.]